jgi:hypothetical protein
MRGVYLLNPLAVVFAAYQETLLFGRFSLHGPLALSALISTLLLVGGTRCSNASGSWPMP